MHVHIGMWFSTVQVAEAPHEPGQGSRHLEVMQARSLEQSEWTAHSGLQLGGLPMKVERHEHDGVPPMSRHSALGPHGDGTQGLPITGVASTVNKIKAFITFTTKYSIFKHSGFTRSKAKKINGVTYIVCGCRKWMDLLYGHLCRNILDYDL